MKSILASFKVSYWRIEDVRVTTPWNHNYVLNHNLIQSDSELRV